MYDCWGLLALTHRQLLTQPGFQNFGVQDHVPLKELGMGPLLFVWVVDFRVFFF